MTETIYRVGALMFKQRATQERKTVKHFRIFAFIGVMLMTTGLAVVQAQTSSANWQATFYNNQQLQDPPVYHASYGDINFDWGSGSPNSAVNNDGWSARFGTDVYFPAGTYRFTVLADDSFQLSVDFETVLNTYNAPRPGDTVTVDVPLTAGTHHLQIDYREIVGNAYLKVNWVDVNAIPDKPITGNWTAQYYSNTALSGEPFATINETAVSHNWGLGAPFTGMPADNFGVRWSTTQNLAPGNYTIRVTADDGVRVFVNGVAYINEWHLATGETYTWIASLPGGATNIVAEYYDAGVSAFIDFSFLGFGTSPQPTGATAEVTAGTLNVRNAPTVVNTTILTKVRGGEVYPIIGRNAASTWWLIDVNGTEGWVSRVFVTASNAENVPVVDGNSTVPSTPAPTGLTVTTVSNLNLRTAPGVSSESLLVIPRGGSATVLGRTADRAWLRVNYNGVVGWVSAAFVTASPPLDFDEIPVQS